MGTDSSNEPNAPVGTHADAARKATGWTYAPASDHGLPPLKRLRSERREPGLLSSAAHGVGLGVLRTYLKVYHRFNIEGAENLPDRTPFVMCANHGSHLDALVLAAALPRAVRHCTFPIAAGDVFFEVPAIAAFSAAFINALPMWRKKVGRHALDDLKARLHAGDCGYILFPEGARTRDGSPLPFKPGIGMMVAATPIPVVPCRLLGCFEALHASSALPRPTRITLRVGKPLLFSDVPQDRAGWEAVAGRIREAVFSLDAGH